MYHKVFLKLINRKYCVNSIHVTLLLCFFVGFGQDYEIESITTNNNTFTSTLPKVLHIDEDGFLWYTTYKGVVKLLGTTDKVFPAVYRDEHLTNYYCSDLLKTNENEVWVTTSFGVYHLNLNNGKSSWFEPQNPYYNRFEIMSSIIEDQIGNIWFGGSSDFLYKYNKQTGEIKIIKISDGAYGRNGLEDVINNRRGIKFKTILNDGVIVFLQYRKWFKIKNDSVSLLHDFDKNNLKEYAHRSILTYNGKFFPKNASGTYLFEDKKYNYIYNSEIDKQFIEVPYNYIRLASLEDPFRTKLPIDLLVAKSDKLLSLSFKNKKGQFYLNIINSIPFEHDITDIVLDSKNYVWVNTLKGIFRVKFKNLNFKRYLYQSENGTTQKELGTRSLIENKNGLFVNAINGFYKLDEDSQTFKTFKLQEKATKAPFLSELMYDFLEQNDSIIWSHGFRESIFKINLNTQTYKTIKIPDSLFKPHPVIFEMIQLDENSLLIGGDVGLLKFNIKTNTFSNYAKLNDAVDLTGKHVFNVYLNRKKTNLWIGMGNGLGLYKKNLLTNSVEHFSSNNSPPNLIGDNVRSIFEDTNDNIWIGTTVGIEKIDLASAEPEQYKVVDHLNNGMITGMLESDTHYWIGTFDGLAFIDKKTKRIREFFEEDGIPNNEFNTRSTLKRQNGEFIFGGINGLVSFNPKDFAIDDENYNIYLTDIKKFDAISNSNKNFVYGLDTISSIDIPFSKNYLTLKFAVNERLNPKEVSFMYRIKEINNEWVNLDNNNTIEFEGLSPGKYSLLVRGFSSRGIPTNTLEYSINVQQVFYKKIWFILSSLIIVVALLIGWLMYRNKQVKLGYQQKIKQQNLEARALRSQMNPHFIFNALNGMQSVLILKGEKVVNDYFGAFSKLLRITLEMGSSETILLTNEIDYLKAYVYLEKSMLNNNLDYTFEIDEKLDVYNIKIPCMFFQPVIENALIHGLVPKKKDRKLKISMKKEGGFLLGIVEDNGIGREASQKLKRNKKVTYKSFATHIMTERINIYNALNDKDIFWKIEDIKSANDGFGTRVLIRIPYTTN